MHLLSPLRSPSAYRILLPAVVAIALGILTSWATLTGYTAGRSSVDVRPAGPSESIKSKKERSTLHLDRNYGQLPLSFEINQGQADMSVKYIARGPGFNILLTNDEAVLIFRQPVAQPDDIKEAESPDEPLSIGSERLKRASGKTVGLASDGNVADKQTTLRMRLEGANTRQPTVEGVEELSGKVNYFLGNDSAKWLSNISTYKKIAYREVYPGIDLVYYGDRQQLEYDLIVSPASDPGSIQITFDGAESMRLDRKGNLQLKTKAGDVLQGKPNVYQEVNGVRKPVNASYVVKGKRIGFKVSKYDREKPLVIDPTLKYLSLVNSSGEGYSITADPSGNAYITGYVGNDLNPTPGVAQPSFGGVLDCFVTKLNATGDDVFFTTYLGGSEDDYGNDIAVDSAGNVYVAGAAASGFPTTGGVYQTSFGGGGLDGFVAKLNPGGTSLIFSTYIGGNSIEEADTIVVEPGTGNFFVSGITASTNLNTTPGVFRSTNKGGMDGYVAKFNSNATSVLFLTYAGGSGYDYPADMATDSQGNVYLAGQTGSLDLPTLNAVQSTHAGGSRGPFKSINGGATFASSHGNLPVTYVYTSVINPSTPSTIYIGTDGGVFKSTDSGASWNPTAQIPTRFVHQLTLLPGSPNIIYAGTEAGVYRSVDGGASWTPRNTGLGISGSPPDVRGLVIPSSSPNTIYAATLDQSVFKSTDGGGTWAAANGGISGLVINANTNAIVIDPTAPNTLYVAIASASRVWKTTNGGTTWIAASTGLPNSTVRALAINPTTPSTLYVANGLGIYKTTNSGTNWAVANSGLVLPLSDASNLSNPVMTFVTVDPVTPTTVYAGASSVLQPAGASSVTTVFKSTDSGGTWTAQSNGFGGINATVGTIAVDPTNNSIVYASTFGDTDSFLLKLNSSGSALVYSTYLGGPRGEFAGSVAVDAGGNAFIAGQTSSPGFSTTAGAFQSALKGASDEFVAKFTSSGVLSYSTLIGGLDSDGTSGGLAIDSSGSAFVTGVTFSVDFPTTPGAFQRTIGNPGSRNSDVFITKVNATGSGLDYSSYLGGDGADSLNPFVGNRLALDAAENAYVVSVTNSTNFPFFEWANQGGIATTHTFVAKITTTPPSYSITGRITNSQGGAGVGGVFVEAADSTGNTVFGQTDSFGFYGLINLPAGDYTVTPQRFGTNGHYIYAPASRSFPGLNSDQTANFAATQAYDITGIISHATIPGLQIFDVTVTLSGSASTSTVTDIFGNFTFRDLVAGNYTVTPTKAGFTFNPVNRVFNALSSDQLANFTTSSGTYVTVSGRAADISNVAISNATVAMRVTSQIGAREEAVQTDANGNYSFINLQTGGNYSFGAFKAAVTFTPLQQTYTNLNANQTLNFTGTATTGLIGKLAFFRETSTAGELAVSNADGSGEIGLGHDASCSGDSGPSWSPDGSRIAFGSCNASGDDDLYLIKPDGTGLTAVSAETALSETFPAWAPEGTRLTYTAGECSGSDSLVPELFAIDATGALKTRLTNNAVIDAASDWSPNGSSILFTKTTNRDCSGDTGDLYTMDSAGGNEHRLTNTAGVEFLASYSPDGTRIAYLLSQDIDSNNFIDNIFVMNADGTGQTQITPNIIHAGRPTWSPDGSRIAFGGEIHGMTGSEQIYVVKADGTGLTQVTSGGGFDRFAPSWQHFSISGHVTGNANGLPITVTLAGTLTRVTRTDASGNYIFGNLAPAGNYTVTPVSTSYSFTPAKIDVNNLNGNQTANFTIAAAIPSPTPPLADDFAAGARDPAKWNLGTQTQPLGAFDPQVSVVQQGGQLVVTPRSQLSGLHYNGYVAVNSFDFNYAKATVEVVQPANNGAETIFAIGSDLDNYSRFVVRAGNGTTPSRKGRLPRDVSVPQLIFQVRVAGEFTSISIPYDPVAHRFMRFRHEPPTNSIIFETSPDNVNFTVRHSVVLQKSVSALTAELSAGTSTAIDPGNAVFDNFNLVTNTFQFAITDITANESTNRATVTVTRSGDTSGPATVDFATFDDTARQRTRYVPAVGTLSFAAGQSSRTFSVLLEDNSLVEGSQTLQLRLIDSSGGGLNSPGRAVLTVDDNDTPPITTNPLDTPQFFVRQNYYDFLSRNPDQGGLDFWTHEITQCGSDQNCINTKRIDVSNAFYFELEFQQTGSYVYRLYRAAYGNNQPFPNPRPDVNFPNEDKKLLSYNAFITDRARVVGGASLAQSQLNLANLFVRRAEFLATYPLSLDGPAFVDAVLNKIKTDIGADLLSQRTALINLYNSGGRAAVIYRLADDNIGTNPINNRAFIDAEYNRAFVATQYFGYLRRNPDLGGFIFWLGQVNSGPLRDVNKQHAMVCSFVTSAEYQERFSLSVTHNNTECPH